MINPFAGEILHKPIYGRVEVKLLGKSPNGLLLEPY